MDQRQIKSIHKKIEVMIEKIREDMEQIDSLIEEAVNLGDICEEAFESLERARDALRELL